jgi:beta-lactamase regulating signal transducer with metallopeptidase domain
VSGVLTWIAHATTLVAVLALSMRLIPRLDAATRYYLWWAAMAAVLILPTVHAAWPATGAITTDSALVLASPSPAAPVSDSGAPLTVVLPDGLALAAPWIVAAAAALVFWRLFTLQRSLAALRRLRRGCRPVPPDLEARLNGWLEARAHGRRARLLVSDEVTSPAMIGAGAPIIALPSWAVATLDADMLDLLVLHEHAHVERCDDRDLLVQASIEAIFAWHPVIRWIGRRLDDERERACDDRVVARTGRATRYAKCLLGVAAYQHRHRELRLAPGMARSRRGLIDRVDRLLAGSRATGTPRSRSLAVSSATFVLVAGVAASAVLGPRVYVAEANWGRMPTSAMTLSSRHAVSLGEPASLVPRAQPPPPVQTTTMSISLASATNLSTSAHATRPARTPAPALQTPAMWPSSPRLETAAPAGGGRAGPTPDERDEVAEPATPWITTPSAEAVASSVLLPATETFEPSAPPPPEPASPWKRTADAGESIGRGAAHAGVKTAGFFSRMGRAIASSF